MRGNGAVDEGGAVERLDGVEPHGVQREVDEHRCRENTVELGRILECQVSAHRLPPQPFAMLTARATTMAAMAMEIVLSEPMMSFAVVEYGIASVGEKAVAAVRETYA